MTVTSSLPAGTVTFLFTDIEESTKRWEYYPQQMEAALEQHDAIMRGAIEANGGLVFRTEGDAFRAAFDTALPALDAALQAQRTLESEPWPEEIAPLRVRMALHTGAIEVRGGDYVGPSLNRMARLLSAAYGGQTLLSMATEQLVRDNLPPDVTLRDLGEHRLKDLIRSEHIFQVVVPDLISDFPPLKTLDNRPNNLPSQRSPLVGRTAELATVQRLLLRDDVGLLTLTGPGGIGKTRLALQIAAELVDEFADGVYFVSLAHITDPTLVAPAIAQTLGVRHVAGREMVDTLGDYLSDKRLLLLLDNFERVVAAAPLVVKLMQAAPGLKVLVTSREVLHVRDEQEFAVPPLGVPNPKHLPSLEVLSQYEAVALFIQRARLIKPDFELTNDNAPAVAEICYRLDGLPLAIELAAARTRLLPPQAMLTRLSSRLRLLTAGARDAPERQQTLRSTIQWSYDLLHPGEQRLFRCMSVFTGGGTLEAIEAVCNGPELRGPLWGAKDGALELDVLDGVASLVDKSLVLVQQKAAMGTGATVTGLTGPAGTFGEVGAVETYHTADTEREPRFGMLQTIREYAMELLQNTEPAGGEELYRQHAQYYLALAEQGQMGTQGPQQELWLDRLVVEHENLQAVLLRAIEQGDADTALRLGGAMWFGGAMLAFWDWRSYYNEGYNWLGEALEMPGAEVRNARRARALMAAARVSHSQNDWAATRAYSEESVAIFRELGMSEDTGSPPGMNAKPELRQQEPAKRSPAERGELGLALATYAFVLALSGEPEAGRAAAEEGVSLLRQSRNKWSLAFALQLRGVVANVQGDLAAARAAFEEGIAISREVGNKWVLAQALNSLGDVSRITGEYARAREQYEESLSLYRRLNARSDIPASLHNLGHVALAQGHVKEAKKLFTEALRLYLAQNDRPGIAECLAGLAGVAGAEQYPERAARLFGAAEAIREALGPQMWPAERADYDRNLGNSRAQVDEAAWEMAWQEGRAMVSSERRIEQAIAYALEDLNETTTLTAAQQP